MPDAAIWQYAKEHDLIIVSKDADFSDWIMLSDPPPKVIHLRIGNMRLRDLFVFFAARLAATRRNQRDPQARYR